MKAQRRRERDAGPQGHVDLVLDQFAKDVAGAERRCGGAVRLLRDALRHRAARHISSRCFEGEGRTGPEGQLGDRAGPPAARCVALVGGECVGAQDLAGVGRYVGACIPGGRPRGERTTTCEPVVHDRGVVGERPVAGPEVPELHVPERLDRPVDRVAVIVPTGCDPQVRVRLAENSAGLGPPPPHRCGRRDLIHALLKPEVVDLEPR